MTIAPALAPTEAATRAEPFIAGARAVFRRDPATRVTVTGCTQTVHGWSVAWREEPAIPGLTPVTGCCPAERLMPADAMWMAGQVCLVFKSLTGVK